MSAPAEPQLIVLRDIWWKDSTKDGSPVDHGDNTQGGYPFADNVAQEIVPRILRNFAFEISQAIATANNELTRVGDVVASNTAMVDQMEGAVETQNEAIATLTEQVTDFLALEDRLKFVIGDNVHGLEGILYYTVTDPVPPSSPEMTGWIPVGDVTGTGIDNITYNPATFSLSFELTNGEIEGPFDLSGAEGPRGATWLTGTGVPSNFMTTPDGTPLIAGDLYLDESTGNVYEFG